MTEGEPSGDIVIYQADDGTPRLEVRVAEDTVWLSQQQLANLFQTSKQNVSLHIRNIVEDGELDRAATVKDFLIVRTEGSRQVSRVIEHYNLDMIISVGYRVKSAVATRFRIWATERLREYLVKGFTMDDERLKDAGGGRYWRELLERIRDIRSSEKVLYRQVLDLYATSVDYDPRRPESREFFQIVQNKLHFAAHGRTAAEVIASRADAGKPFMGLLTFSGASPRKADIGIAKNYLDQAELTRLNTLVSAYFDAAEFRAQRREPTCMSDWLGHLDRLIVALDAELLTGPGSVSHQRALDKAAAEYDKYKEQRDAEPSPVERDYLAELRSTQKKLEGKPE